MKYVILSILLSIFGYTNTINSKMIAFNDQKVEIHTEGNYIYFNKNKYLKRPETITNCIIEQQKQHEFTILCLYPNEISSYIGSFTGLVENNNLIVFDMFVELKQLELKL